MANFAFNIERVEAEKYAATPLLLFSLRIANAGAEPRIENIMLNCQIRIEPTRRVYSLRERERLGELFGPPEQWGETLHSLLWTHANVAVPGFERETRVSLPAHCTNDFSVASAKYFYGLVDGAVDLAQLIEFAAAQ